MKNSKTGTYWVISLAFLILSSCSGKAEEKRKEEQLNQESDKYYQFSELNLSEFDFMASIKVPDETAGIGASFKPVITHDEDFKWTISAGPNFMLYIEDYGDYSLLMNDFKKKMYSSDLFDIKIISEKNGVILYSRQIKKTTTDAKNEESKHITFHLYAIKKLGNVYYEIKNKDEGDSKKVSELMEKSVASLKLIK